MSLREPPFTVGIEEEYLLVDRRTGELANDPPPRLLEECGERSGGQISPEFLRCQVEVGTRVAHARHPCLGRRADQPSPVAVRRRRPETRLHCVADQRVARGDR